MDLGQNYTQFVDDVESGEFDNFLSKNLIAFQKYSLYFIFFTSKIWSISCTYEKSSTS